MSEKITLIIDSGIGGITFLDEVIKQRINGNYLYIADTINAPYGDKTPEFIRSELLKLISFINQKIEVEKVIFACNTAAVTSQEYLSKHFEFPFESVIDVTKAYFLNENQLNIDWLATETTINTHYLTDYLTHLNINEIACGGFVPLIESGNFYEEVSRRRVVEEALGGKANVGTDFVILGCTHYPYLLKELKEVYDEKTVFFNPSYELAKSCVPNGTKVKFNVCQTGSSEFFEDYVLKNYGCPTFQIAPLKMGESNNDEHCATI